MNILKNPHFIFDVHVTEVVDASLSVIAQTFMDACTKSEHKLSRVSANSEEEEEEEGGVKEQAGRCGEKTKPISTKWISMRNKEGQGEQSQRSISLKCHCFSLSVSRTLQVTNYSMQRRSPPTRRWWTSESNKRFTTFVLSS